MSETKTPSNLETVEISNKLSMNLTKEDLIDLVVEAKVDELEIKLNDAKEIAKAFQAELTTAGEDIVKKHQHDVENLPEFKQFAKACEIFGLKPQPKEDLVLVINNAYAADVKSTFRQGDLVRAEDTKNVVSNYRNNTCIVTRGLALKDTLAIIYTADTPLTSLKFDINVKLTAHDRKILKNEAQKKLAQYTEAKNAEYEAELELLKAKYGNKRFKNTLIRASLRKSKDGKSILDMLEKAGGVKLLT